MRSPVLTLDHRQPDAARFLLPEPCRLASSGWRDLHLALYQQPKFATAEHSHPLHVLACGLGDASGICPTGSRWLDGVHQPEQRQSGDIAVIPAGVLHRCSWDGAAQFMVLAIEPELLRRVGQDWIDPDQIDLIPRYMTHQDALLQGIFLALKDEVTSGGIGGPLLMDSLKTALGIHLLRHYCATQPKRSIPTHGLSDSRFALVTDYIQAHLDHDLTLSEIAAIAQISPYHFGRLFKQRTGKTLHQYIVQRRVEQAQYWLQQGNLSLADVAVRVGFCDQSHLTRHFKRIVGVTPKQFRQA